MYSIAIIVALILSGRLVRARHRTLSNACLTMAMLLIFLDMARLIQAVAS